MEDHNGLQFDRFERVTDSPGLALFLAISRGTLRTLFLVAVLSLIGARAGVWFRISRLSAEGWMVGAVLGLVIGPFVRLASSRGGINHLAEVERNTSDTPLEPWTLKDFLRQLPPVASWGVAGFYGLGLASLLWTSAAASPWGHGPWLDWRIAAWTIPYSPVAGGLAGLVIGLAVRKRRLNVLRVHARNAIE